MTKKHAIDAFKFVGANTRARGGTQSVSGKRSSVSQKGADLTDPFIEPIGCTNFEERRVSALLPPMKNNEHFIVCSVESANALLCRELVQPPVSELCNRYTVHVAYTSTYNLDVHDFHNFHPMATKHIPNLRP